MRKYYFYNKDVEAIVVAYNIKDYKMLENNGCIPIIMSDAIAWFNEQFERCNLPKIKPNDLDKVCLKAEYLVD